MSFTSLIYGVAVVFLSLTPNFSADYESGVTYINNFRNEFASKQFERVAKVKEFQGDKLLIEKDGVVQKIKLGDNFKAYINPATERQNFLNRRAESYEGDCPHIKLEELKEFGIREINPQKIQNTEATLFIVFDGNKFLINYLIIKK